VAEDLMGMIWHNHQIYDREGTVPTVQIEDKSGALYHLGSSSPHPLGVADSFREVRASEA
jgi:hypothetical protein